MTNGRIPHTPLIPELLVLDIGRSLDFWCGLLGFRVLYERRQEGFARLALNGADVMLEQRDCRRRNWITGALKHPYGRGINLQIDVGKLGPVLSKLEKARWPVSMEAEERWYRAEDAEVGQNQALVQDPDGYLLRLIERLGVRPLVKT